MSAASPTKPIRTPALANKVAAAAAAALACALSLYVAPNALGVCGALLALLMAAIAYRDFQDFIIPDPYSAAAFVLALVAAWIGAEQDVVSAIAACLMRAGILALAFLALRTAYYRLRGRQGLGLGDVKLAGVAGAWLDWTTIPIALEVAVLAALTAVLAHQLITRRRLHATTRLPFGLFLAPAIWVGWVIQTALPWEGPW
jgi:leader peptidase (prepilin peptidase) / N-methyltransferase